MPPAFVEFPFDNAATKNSRPPAVTHPMLLMSHSPVVPRGSERDGPVGARHALAPVHVAKRVNVGERQHGRVRFGIACGRLWVRAEHRVDQRNAADAVYTFIAQKHRHAGGERRAGAVTGELQCGARWQVER